MRTIHTIGHSTHSIEKFISLLKNHNIDAIGDVRSRPYSRYQPHFSQANLEAELQQENISYVFLGNELGARTDNSKCYDNNRVSYSKLAATPLFQAGLDRIDRGSKSYNLALMCAEKDPLECHRTILIGRHLVERKFDVRHILESGEIESHSQSLARLIEDLNISRTPDMFNPISPETESYAIKEEKIAYRKILDTRGPN
jgi:uncharacterized protein (DUF488 family)